MNYEELKEKFREQKKGEFDYINHIVKISRDKILTEYEKIEIYRKIKDYENKLNEILENLFREACKDNAIDSLDETIIEIDVDKNYLSSIVTNHNSDLFKTDLLENYLRIDTKTYKYTLTISDLLDYHVYSYKSINPILILNGQKIIDNTIYVFCGYHDYSEDICGPFFEDSEDLISKTYVDIFSMFNDYKEIPAKEAEDFEKDNIIINSKKYVSSDEIKFIFKKELLNIQNKSINDCVISTKKIIDELNHVRSPEYKEKVLLNRINELYQKVKGNEIDKTILYNGKFIDVIRETYNLPNNKIIEKEKVIKNKGKNSVIVIALTRDKYIITVQNRIDNQMLLEFPSGYIEDGEDVIEAANRELEEETGYKSDDLFILTSAYTSPGTDNSLSYIVVANNAKKVTNTKNTNSELLEYDLFSELELQYLINNDIIKGAINKLAYYCMINNTTTDEYSQLNENKKFIIKKLVKLNKNPLK